MSNLLYLIASLFILIILNGCNSHSNNKNKAPKSILEPTFLTKTISLGDPAIIAGIIHNKNIYPNTKEVRLEIPDFKGFEQVYKTLIDSAGNFKFAIYPITTREISLKPVADAIIIHPGDSIFIETDFKISAGAVFSGDAAELNNNIYKFLFGSYLGRYANSNNYPIPKDFKDYCTKYRNDAIAKLNTFCSQNKTTDEFKDWAVKTIEIDYSQALLYYLINKFKQRNQIEYKEDYYNFLDDLNKVFDNSVICANYFDLISKYYNYYMVPSIVKDFPSTKQWDYKRDSLFITKISCFSKNKFLNQFSVSHYFNTMLNTHEVKFFEESMGFIDKTIYDPFLLKTLADRYHYIKSYTANPESLSDAMLDVSDFDNQTINFRNKNSTRPKLVNEIIKANKNKVIYIDFWAVWCPPCIPELTISKKLIQQFKGQNVEFVFICLSDSTVAQKKIAEFKMGGTHYFLNSDESIFFQNKFGFQSIPHYVLIDKKGIIVDFGSALRPSNPRTIEKINDNLIK